MHFKSLLRNLNLHNLILIIVLIIFANTIFSTSADVTEIKYNQPQKPVDRENIHEKTTENRHVPSLGEYAIIGDQNLFHPTRSIISAKEEKPEPKPEFVLYGTLITDNLRFAYIEDRKSPRSTPGRGKRQTALKIGDTMSGFTLKEVDIDKVVMVRGEERVEIKVIDPSTKKERKVQITPQPQTGPPTQKVRKP